MCVFFLVVLTRLVLKCLAGWTGGWTWRSWRCWIGRAVTTAIYHSTPCSYLQSAHGSSSKETTSECGGRWWTCSSTSWNGPVVTASYLHRIWIGSIMIFTWALFRFVQFCSDLALIYTWCLIYGTHDVKGEDHGQRVIIGLVFLAQSCQTRRQ